MNSTLMKNCLNLLASPQESEMLLKVLKIHPSLLPSEEEKLSRAQISMLLNILLYNKLIQKVPEAYRYTVEALEKHKKINFDHGALRTVSMQMKALPSGRHAFSRILEPLGYQEIGVYPLDKLKMCGFVYTHSDFPEDIPQYFVSELYPERFSDKFISTVETLVYDSVDPLTDDANQLLLELSTKQSLDKDSSIKLLEVLPLCFDRQHPIPSLTQYKTLLSESAEMAWISTEGNAFNHATDRVKNLDQLEMEERNKGRNMKPKIEEGKNANIRQTAYRASVVERVFEHNSKFITMQVPGSFFEFIERGTVFDSELGKERMDLRFDSQNAQGIFKMTENKV